MEYSKGFKDRMVQRMSGVRPISAGALAREVGISQPTLSKWLRQACLGHPPRFLEPHSCEEVMTMSAKRPQDWSAQEKLQVVLEASSLPSKELGAFLRSKGLHESHLEQWRSQMLNGLHDKASSKKTTKKNAPTKEVKELKRELARKEKALAEAAALLVLKKKAQSIWGDEDEDTPGKNGK